MSGDFNGDGKTDFSFIQDGTQWVFLANGAPTDLVSSIQTGLGATTSVTYQPLTNPNIYLRANDRAKYPLQNIQPPLYVVSQVDAPNGIAGTYSSAYSYYGAKVDLSGRGFLGFQGMATLDRQTNLLRTTNYLVGFPTQGLSAFPCLGLTQSVVKAIGAQPLNATYNTYTYTNKSGTAQTCGETAVSAPSNANAPYQVSVSATQADSWDLDGTALPTSATTYQYDKYGNPTVIATTTSDGFGKTITNTLHQRHCGPALVPGRLNSATVTSTTP
jgi:hypothetical protein